METRANHLVVGTFVLVVIAGLFGFALWLGKAQIDREFDRYHIYFTDSVSGLSTASTVRYRGVPVGTVVDIRIDPGNSERVRVTIEATGGTPIKEDSIATLELQGVTGLVDVEISGGSRTSPSLEPEPGEKLAVIASATSRLETLFESLPHAINRFTTLVERGTLLFSDDNIVAIQGTLENINTLTSTLAASADDIEAFTGDVAITTEEVRHMAEEIAILVEEIRGSVPDLVDNAQLTLTDVRESAQSLNASADELTAMLAENRPAFRDFTIDGLYELSRFLVEARALVDSMTRITDRFESDPARFLFGDAQAGFEPE